MGRKAISPKTRSIPVSFSVKPYLADKIENLAFDQRFTRSKFLQEAVLRYINFIEMKDSPMLHDMSAEQRVAIGANALLESNRDGDEISPRIIKHLKKQLEVFELKNLIKKIDENDADTKQQLSAATEADITFEKVPMKSEYQVFNSGRNIGKIIKRESNHRGRAKGVLWISSVGGSELTYKTLKAAKAAVLDRWE